MSFILDALRKSDQQRHRGATPTLLTAQALAMEPKQPAYWIHGLLATVLVATGVAIGWLRPWQPEPPVAGGQPVAAMTIAEKPRVSSPSTPRPAAPAPLPAVPDASGMAIPETTIPKPVPIAAPASPAAASQDRSAQSPSSAEARGAPLKPVTAAPREPPAPPSEKPAGPADSAPQPKVMSLSELPVSIRQELPAMQILLHQYSPRPRNRFVTINNQTLQEGESVAPGITLEQITPDGMILSYRGYRFRRGVQ